MQNIKILNNSEKRLYLLITLVSMIILISGMRKTDANILLVFLSLPLVSHPVTLVPMLFVTSWNMTFSIFGLGAYFYYFILFLIGMAFSHRHYGNFIGSNRTTLLYLLFSAYIIYSAVFSISHVTEPAIRLMCTILSVAFVGMYQCRDHIYIYKSLFWIALVASIYFGFRMLISPMQFTIENETSYTIINSRPTILRHVNPNAAAQIITILSIILFITAIRIKRYKILIIFALFLNLNTLLSLASRTSFYALGISFALYLFFASNLSKTRKFFYILLTAGGMYLLNEFIVSIESRLILTSVLEDEGNNRFITWMRLWEDVIPKYWLKGFGYGRANYDYLDYPFDADNMYIDLLCQLGVIGSALFYFLHFDVMKRVNSVRMDSIGMECLFFILCCFLIFGFGESVFDTPLYWASLLLVSSLLPDKYSNTNNFYQLPK